jgi:transcription elongation factor Elf1
MSGASGEEIDHYFAVNSPYISKKILCHSCGGLVDNSLQELKAEIAAYSDELSAWSEEENYGVIQVRLVIDRLRQLIAL